MDLSGFFENIKEKISDLKDWLFDWIEENKKLALIIASLIFVILICLILLIVLASSGKKKEVKVPDQELIINEQLLIPNGPELPRDYTLSRQTKESWTDQEIEPWFTTPSEKEINSLSQSNDNMINEIIKAAP
ncbi:MAG: hypothetical protein K5681_07505 [Treponema sp.]|nr:hypothetical protein [Treponema sp.]